MDFSVTMDVVEDENKKYTITTTMSGTPTCQVRKDDEGRKLLAKLGITFKDDKPMCKVCDNEEQNADGKEHNGMVYNSCEEVKEQSCCGMDMEEMAEETGLKGMDYGKKGTSKPHIVTMD